MHGDLGTLKIMLFLIISQLTDSFSMKLFNTGDMQIVTECQSIVNFRLPSVIIPDRCEAFRVKYESCNNSLYYKLALSPL